MSTPDYTAAHHFFNNRFHYRALVHSIYDADTLDVIVDMGFGVAFQIRLRLNRIDAWELRGDEKDKGFLARDWLRSAIPVGGYVYVKSIKDKKGKYGRYLAEIYALEDGNYININDELVSEGHAVYKDYS